MSTIRLELPAVKARGSMQTGNSTCPFCHRKIGMERRCPHIVDVDPPAALILDSRVTAPVEIEDDLGRAIASAMRDGTRRDRLRLLLLQGPVTSSEVAAELDCGVRIASAMLSMLSKRGEAEPVTNGSRGPNGAAIWRLTERGERIAMRLLAWQGGAG